MNVKKTVIIPVLVFIIAALSVGAVAAQEGEPPPPMDEQGAVRGVGRIRLAMHAQRLLMQTIMEQTGLDRREIGDHLRDGKTLEQIITESGGDVDAIVDAAISTATERVNQAIQNGRLTPEQGSELLAPLEAYYQGLLSGDVFRQRVERLVGLGVLRFAGERTGLAPREIVQQIRGGKSLADVLTDNGVDVNQFIEDATARVEARLNVQVVDERMTEERAAELLEQFRTALTERITQRGLPEPLPEGVPAV